MVGLEEQGKNCRYMKYDLASQVYTKVVAPVKSMALAPEAKQQEMLRRTEVFVATAIAELEGAPLTTSSWKMLVLPALERALQPDVSCRVEELGNAGSSADDAGGAAAAGGGGDGPEEGDGDGGDDAAAAAAVGAAASAAAAGAGASSSGKGSGKIKVTEDQQLFAAKVASLPMDDLSKMLYAVNDNLFKELLPRVRCAARLRVAFHMRVLPYVTRVDLEALVWAGIKAGLAPPVDTSHRKVVYKEVANCLEVLQLQLVELAEPLDPQASKAAKRELYAGLGELKELVLAMEEDVDDDDHFFTGSDPPAAVQGTDMVEVQQKKKKQAERKNKRKRGQRAEEEEEEEEEEEGDSDVAMGEDEA